MAKSVPWRCSGWFDLGGEYVSGSAEMKVKTLERNRRGYGGG
jgi:hypothetical protein